MEREPTQFGIALRHLCGGVSDVSQISAGFSIDFFCCATISIEMTLDTEDIIIIVVAVVVTVLVTLCCVNLCYYVWLRRNKSLGGKHSSVLREE